MSKLNLPFEGLGFCLLQCHIMSYPQSRPARISVHMVHWLIPFSRCSIISISYGASMGIQSPMAADCPDAGSRLGESCQSESLAANIFESFFGKRGKDNSGTKIQQKNKHASDIFRSSQDPRRIPIRSTGIRASRQVGDRDPPVRAAACDASEVSGLALGEGDDTATTRPRHGHGTCRDVSQFGPRYPFSNIFFQIF